MKRSYQGPLIESTVELGIIHQFTAPYSEVRIQEYALAVDAGTGELVLLCNWNDGKPTVSGVNPSGHTLFADWRVTV